MPWRVLVKLQIHNLHRVMDLIMRSVGKTWNSLPFQAIDFVLTVGRCLRSDCPVFKIILMEAAANTSVAVQSVFPVFTGSAWGEGNSFY